MGEGAKKGKEGEGFDEGHSTLLIQQLALLLLELLFGLKQGFAALQARELLAVLLLKLQWGGRGQCCSP